MVYIRVLKTNNICLKMSFSRLIITQYLITLILSFQNIPFYYNYNHIGVSSFVFNSNLLITKFHSDKEYNIIQKHINNYHCNHLKLSDQNENNNNNNPKKSKSTKFDRIIDDFIGKKYGAGEAFYGRRTSGLTEEEYDSIRYNGKKSQTDVMSDYDKNDMKSNAILVYGDIDSNILSWIVLELLEKGFIVRLACEDRNLAIDMFGSPGMNVDMIQLKPDSSEKLYARAIQDVQAIIFCDNIEPVPSPFINKVKDNFLTMERLLDISIRAREATVGEVQKLVMLSRFIPSYQQPTTTTPSSTSSSMNHLSTIVGSIASIANKLFTDILNAEEEVYSTFRELHRTYEEKIRSSGIEYVIVRAPATVLNSRPGALDNLRVIHSSSGNSRPTSKFVGALDIAEAVVQSLLLDQIEGITYTVYAATIETQPSTLPQSNQPTANNDRIIDNNDGSISMDRISRSTYYGILALDDSTDPIPFDEIQLDSKEKNIDKDKLIEEIDASNAVLYSEMRSSYMIRPVDSYRNQIEEDEKVEKYWYTLLRNLPRD